MPASGLPYPTIIGIVGGGEWASTVLDRVIADGRYGVRLGQTPAEAESELRVAIASACAGDEFLRDHPATIEITGGRFGSARVPSDHPLPIGLAAVVTNLTRGTPAPLCASRSARGRQRRDAAHAGAARRAIRRRHADVRQRRQNSVRHLRSR